MVTELEFEDTKLGFADLLLALQRLDRLLAGAIARAEAIYGSDAVTDRYRGLHVTLEEVQQILGRSPGDPLLYGGEPEAFPATVGERSLLTWLQQTYGLSAFEMDVLILALAPEVDLRYERLYAYLQDNVSRKRPTVDLALNLLCPSVEAKLRGQAHFASEAPLIRHQLLQVFPEPNQGQAQLLAQSFRLDEQIVRLLLRRGELDSRLQGFCQRIEPGFSGAELPLPVETGQSLRRLVYQARETGESLQVYFQGARGAGKRRTAIELAGELDMPLLLVNLPRMLAESLSLEQALLLLFREAWLQDAVLYLEGWDALQSSDSSGDGQQLLEQLQASMGITILAGTQPWIGGREVPVAVMTVVFPMPDFVQRRTCWLAELEAVGIVMEPEALDALADRFRLMPSQIAQAVVEAGNRSRWRLMTLPEGELIAEEQPTLEDLFAAARSQSGQDLGTLARKINPLYTWADLVLPEDGKAQLQEICQRVTHRQQVWGQWGFDRRLSLGKGVNALFVGPSGTGKTMAAEVIANELRLDLYKIDLSGVVSKYIGETEKNLERIFQAAESANAILFFDEADALFGKRSEVRDSHDRYANLEISYLLQKMEQYEGIAILATNLKGNLDEAFVRRLTFTVHFPMPDEANRRQIWSNIWPDKTPLDADVDLDWLAQQFKFSGGNIRNVALAAAFLAAADNETITMAHLRRAIRREYQKLGKTLSDAELSGNQGAAQS